MVTPPDRTPRRQPADVYAALVRVVHLVGQAGAAELREHDLTPAQFQLLVALRGGSAPMQWELGERLGVTKGNVSQMVSRLEARGLLARVPRGAANELALTPDGEELVSRLVPDQRRFLASVFADLEPDELDSLGELVDRVARTVSS